MKKFRKLFLSLIFMFVCVLGLTYNVKAEEEYSIKAIVDTNKESFDGDFFNLYLFLGDDYVKEDENIYYVRFVNNVSELPVVTKAEDLVEKGEKVGQYNEVRDGKIVVEDDWYMLNGYNLAYIIKCYDSGRVCEVLENSVTVPRPELPTLGTRYDFYLGYDVSGTITRMSLHPLFPYNTFSSSAIGDHEINVKIGIINNNELLTKIANKSAGSYEQLLEYAKINEGKYFTNRDDGFSLIEINGVPIVNGAFYYVYTYYTNADGLYRNLDDIQIIMAKNNLLITDVDLSSFAQESLWDKFVKEFKNTDVVKSFKEGELEISHTQESLSIVMKNGESTHTTNFSYKDGIMKYEPTSENDDIIYIDKTWQLNAIYALSMLKGYDIDKVRELIEETRNKTLTIEKDGIVYTEKEYDVDGKKKTILTSFELDILNGLKGYNTENNKEIVYKFISGENQKYTIGKTKELKFEIDGKYSQFENVYINGKLLDEGNYKVSEGEGTTVLVLKKAYLDKLNNGVYTLKVQYKDGGYAQTQFTIEKTIKNPSTGMGITCGILILSLVFAGIYALIRKQSKFPKHN